MMTTPSTRVHLVKPIAPEFYEHMDRAVDDVLQRTRGVDLGSLAERSPGLRGYDWSAYLRCCVVRGVHVGRALDAHVVRNGRVLDVGAYFGHFALAAARAGYQVDALDSYAAYGAALAGCQDLMRESGVGVLDFEQVGYDMARIGDDTYDAVLCLGVIEHVPHTPRGLLQAITRVLKPGGVLILDTPNLAYLYTRRKLARGDSIFPPVEHQFGTALPFEGHHREYTSREVRWMLEAVGHEVVQLETFNFSTYARAEVPAAEQPDEDLMRQDAELRELIFTVSRNPAVSAAARR